MALPPIKTPAVIEALFAGQWHLFNTKSGELDLNIGNIWDDYTGRGVNVAVYDSGVDASHRDLDNNYNASLEVPEDLHPGPDLNVIADEDKDKGHGTAVAGIIAAEANGSGTIGVAYDANITSVDISGFRAPNYKDFYEHFQDFDVVNMSNGPEAQFQNQDDLFTEYENAVMNGRGGLGTIIIQSAGNDRLGPNGVTTIDSTKPWAGDANSDFTNNAQMTVVVGAVDRNGDVEDYSNPGANLLVSAFGDQIVTTDVVGTDGSNKTTSASGGDYRDNFGGTSSATPMVAGIVALMLEANPNLGWRDVHDILALSARHVGSDMGAAPSGSEKHTWTFNKADNWNGGGMHFSNDYGYGLVDAHAAVRLAESWTQQTTSHNDVVATGWRFATTGRIDLAEASTLPNEFRINITEGVDIDSIGLWMDLTHSKMSDLKIEIRSPEGTWSTLTNRTGLGGQTFALTDDMNGWTFTSNAFRGEIGKGEWVIRVWDQVDSGVFDNGSIGHMSLRVNGSAPTVNDQFIYTDEYGKFYKSPDSFGNSDRIFIDDLDGGIDTINAAAVTTGSIIDLNALGFNVIAGGLMQIKSGTVIENAIGGDGNDSIAGNGVKNVIRGNRGNDTIMGFGGADVLDGDHGDDTLIGGALGDILSGGEGNDTASYNSSARAVTVKLGDHLSGSWNGTATGGDAAGDKLYGIENLEGSGFNDLLTGNGASNVLIGGAGNDQLDGGGGSDILIGGLGNDIYIVDSLLDVVIEEGGAGSGTKDHIKSTLGTYLLADNVEILEFTNALDSHHGVGNAGDNRMFGHHGNDLLEGAAGNDILSGGRGNDTLLGGDNNDTLFGEDGNDTLNGGAGNDTLDGGLLSDTLQGGTGVNTLIGGAGRDIFRYFGNVADIGTDTVFGGTRTADAVADQDTLDFSGLDGSVDVNLTSARFTATNGRNYFETGTARATSGAISGIEVVIGTAYGDSLSGNASINTLSGGAGNDILHGGAGADTLLGGAGNDLFFADSLDKLDGGDGYDTVHVVDGKAHTFRLAGTNIEYVHGNIGNDTLDATGVTTAITLVGADGNDVITGGSGDDRIQGGSGTNRLLGGGGNDNIDGGVGRDYIDGGAGNDYLYGGGGVDTLLGGEGDDILFTDNFDVDIINGGAGYDQVYADTNTIAGGFKFKVTAAMNIEGVSGNHGNDVIDASAITSNLYLVGFYGDDVITGGSGNDTINGDAYYFSPAGNDILYGGAGSDHMYGYNGDDIMYGGGSNPAAGYGDRLWGGGGNDTLYGGGDGWVFGEEGNDTLTGAAGDYLWGGDGNDTLRSSTGSEYFVGGTGADRFELATAWGRDTIGDFNFAEGDKIDLSKVAALDTFAQLTVTEGTDVTWVSLGSDSIALNGITAAQVQADWFIL